MVDDSVGRTRSVTGMSGFAGHPKEQQPPPRRALSEPSSHHDHDEVCLHAGDATALRLLRERVLAATRADLMLEHVTPPVFAELVEGDAHEGYLGRLLSAQNQLAGHATPRPDLRAVLAAAFDRGLAETRELLRDLGLAGVAAIDSIAAEVHARRKRAAADVDAGS